MRRWFSPSSGTFSLIIFALCFVLIGIDRASTQAAQVSLWRGITFMLYEWVILLSAFALLAGVFNLGWTHFRRIQQGGDEWILSLVLLIVLTFVLMVGLLDRLGTASAMIEWIFRSIIAPSQTALFALLGVFLVTAAYRYLHIGRTGGIWMLAGAIAMFAIQMPLARSALAFLVNPSVEPTTSATSVELGVRWLLEWPVMGVFRGAIIGSAISLLVVAVRFLVGQR